MKTYAFDLEVFKNFFSVIFVDVENEFDRETFIIFEDRDDSEKIREFLDRNITLCGYNSHHFDNVLLIAILEGYTLPQLYELSQNIISRVDKESISELKYKKTKFKSIDFKELIGSEISLKQVTVNMEWLTIQDLPIPFDSEVKPEQVELILKYNLNDVLPLVKLWNDLSQEISLRKRVSQLYGVDVSSVSESQIPNHIFEKLYSSATKQPIKEIKQLRTHRTHIPLSSCVNGNIQFSSHQMSSFYEKVKELDLIKGFSTVLDFAGLKFNLGVGGIHTQDKPGCFYSDDEYQIIDADVTSFYPNIILHGSIKPAHLSQDFLTILNTMTKQRIEAKTKGKKTDADILKIVINATFGKLGNENYWLYDEQAFYSVTISGQLYLLMLIEMLHDESIEVLSANTDGVICRVNNELSDKYKLACQNWEGETGFSLEYSLYKKYIRKDVNNYIAQGDKVKRKGIFETRDSVSLYYRLIKSYRPNIIPLALSKYFLDNVPPDETIRDNKNIFDFLMSQRSSRKYEIVLRRGFNEEILQKTNRWYVSNSGGIILKREGNKELAILANTEVKIANDLETTDVKHYDVNYDYYITEVKKIINQIKPSVQQMTLF